VLALTQRTSVPLAERLRYVCIVSSNLDEFFEIRISELMGEMRETGGINQASPLWDRSRTSHERAHGWWTGNTRSITSRSFRRWRASASSC